MLSSYQNVVVCPSCGNDQFKDDMCGLCGFIIEYFNDVADLRTNKSFDTHLDVEKYEVVHQFSGESTPSLCQSFCALLEQKGLKPYGDALEIACGSGNLTASLLVDGRFDAVHCGDISPAFMRKMSQRVQPIVSQTSLKKYMFDANHLPFKDNSFNFVFGNSVLHHFATFENTLRDCFRVLKAGGAATFGEPILDGLAYVSLVAGLIVRSPEIAKAEGMTNRHFAILEGLGRRAGNKIANLNSDRSKLDEIEDKFEFPIAYLTELSRDIGFSEFVVSKTNEKFKLGQALKSEIFRTFDLLDLDVKPLNSFDYIFDAFDEDYGAAMRAYIPPLFARMAFIK